MCGSKICFKCNVEKPLSEFYKHKAMADGHLNKCKECNRKDVRENRDKNIDYYREYDKQRANNPNRVEGRLRFSQTEAGKEVARQAKARWASKNLIKRAAIQMVNNAIRDGKIIKLSMCTACGETGVRTHGHHDDYSKPLEVRWLCSKCHRAWHKEHGEALNG